MQRTGGNGSRGHFSRLAAVRFGTMAGNHRSMVPAGKGCDVAGMGVMRSVIRFAVQRAREMVAASAVAAGVMFLFAAALGASAAAGGELLIGSQNPSSVLKFDRASPAFGTFVAGGSGGLNFPRDMILGADAKLYVASSDSNSVLRYDAATGQFIDAFVPAGRGGLSRPSGIVFGPNGDLFVAQETSSTILRYSGTTGAFLGVFATDPVSVGSGGLTFGPDGNLYAANARVLPSSSVAYYVDEFDGVSGNLLGKFVGEGSYSVSRDLAFGPDGNLYLASDSPRGVMQFNGTSGAVMKSNFLTGAPAGRETNSLLFGPDGKLYVAFRNLQPTGAPGSVYAFDAATGSALEIVAGEGVGGLSNPYGLVLNVPEPGTWLAGLLLVGVTTLSKRGRAREQARQRRHPPELGAAAIFAAWSVCSF